MKRLQMLSLIDCSTRSRLAACLVAFFVLAGAGPPRGDDDEAAAESTAGAEGQDAGDATFDAADKLPPATDLAAEAERIVRTARETTYSHRTTIDERAGRFDVDCSGFVGYLLRRAAPAARAELIAATVKRPLARHFVQLVAGLPAAGVAHWRRIERVAELRRGDIIAWMKPLDSR